MGCLVYLHGFASGPDGAKARHCRAWAEAHAISFFAPDLNLPDFEHLTLSAQVAAVEALLDELLEPAVLVGSSLGGLVGAAVAHRGAALRHLVLLAPAFGFARRRLEGPRWEGYRHHRRLKVFHHAEARWKRLGPELLEDLNHWRDDQDWCVPCPVTVIHGLKDESVPLAESRAFRDHHPHAALWEVEDDHSLLAPETLALLDRVMEGALLS
jgi:pimeloyl-ACP methyl ester carboxylesterase